jgi:ADP-ribosylglycohydrolase
LTIATIDALLNKKDYAEAYTDYFWKYAGRGWGGSFQANIRTNKKLVPYESYGNGAVMRISPIAWFYKDPLAIIHEAEESAKVSHNHPEGIKGARAICAATVLAQRIKDKKEIKSIMEKYFDYDIKEKLSDYPRRKFDVTCQGTVPRCLTAFFECESIEEGIKKLVLLGGDVDTNLATALPILEAFYGRPKREWEVEAWKRLPDEFRELVAKFLKEYVYNDFEAPDVEKLVEEEDKDLVRLMSSLFS